MTKSKSQNLAQTSINFRIPSDTKEKIAFAAFLEGLTLTDFAIQALSKSADEVLESQKTPRLTDRDRDVFLAMLDADDEPNQALKDAFKAHQDLISE